MRGCLVLVASLMTVLAGGRLWAKPLKPDARMRFDRGAAHYAAKEYEAAIIEFEAAFVLDPRTGVVLDANQAGNVRFVLVGLGLMLLLIFRPQGIFGDRREIALQDR